MGFNESAHIPNTSYVALGTIGVKTFVKEKLNVN